MPMKTQHEMEQEKLLSYIFKELRALNNTLKEIHDDLKLEPVKSYLFEGGVDEAFSSEGVDNIANAYNESHGFGAEYHIHDNGDGTYSVNKDELDDYDARYLKKFEERISSSMHKEKSEDANE